jgi:hypothetical protein
MPRNGDGLFKKGRIRYFKIRSPDHGDWKDISSGTAVYADAPLQAGVLGEGTAWALACLLADWTLEQALDAEMKYVTAINPPPLSHSN